MIMTTDTFSHNSETGLVDPPTGLVDPLNDLALFEIPGALAGRCESIPNLVEMLESGLAAQLECSILPKYLNKRRWFAAKDQTLASIRIGCLTRLPGTDWELVLSEIEIEGDGKPGRWLLPLSVVGEKRCRDLTKALALARIRGGRREGLLTDGYSLAEFAHRMLECLATGAQISATQGLVVFAPAVQAEDRLKGLARSPVTWLSAEQSNSSLIVGDAVMLKIFRRISPGQHDDVESWMAATRASLDAAFKALDRVADGKAGADVHALSSKREALFDALEGLAASGEGSAVSRIHGDFHLGQVLAADGDAYIIDFEGEPSADLAERRRKSSPLNDVAGLLRSFDYALTVAVHSRKGGIHSASMRHKVLAPLVDRAKTAFLEAYRTPVANLSSLDDANLLDLFLIRKAAYEIAYEAANRPEWLALPVTGLVEIMQRVLNHGAGAVR
jgi:predicted trehalose synthase